jgi:hypothetical protein
VNGEIYCDQHGKSASASVCRHVVGSLQSGGRSGFNWAYHDDLFQAVCDGCKNMSDQDWEGQKDDLHVVICLDCYREAANLHGITSEMLEAEAHQ